MEALSFEWDERKDAANQAKHKIGFAEARTVFYDPAARVIPDPNHSDGEDRFIVLGVSQALRLLVVVHCLRQRRTVIRIISARKATRTESAAYRGR